MADGSGRPAVLGSETEHFWLVQRMAKATGVDLVKAMDDGRLSHSDWSGIVTRCRTCQWVEGCDRFLSLPDGAARDLPEPCLNAGRLAGLKEQIEEQGE